MTTIDLKDPVTLEVLRKSRQTLRLMCIECGSRFRARAAHWLLHEDRVRDCKAIRCPDCGSPKFDSDPDKPVSRLDGKDFERLRNKILLAGGKLRTRQVPYS